MRRFLTLLLVVVLVAVVAGVLVPIEQSPFITDPLGFASEDIREVILALVTADPATKEKVDFSTNDPRTISTIVSSMKRGHKYWFPHRCMWFGTLTFKLRDSRTECLEIRPGHDESYYEIRSNEKLYRIARDPFMAAMQDLGVAGQRLLRFPDLEGERP